MKQGNGNNSWDIGNTGMMGTKEWEESSNSVMMVYCDRGIMDTLEMKEN